jgi:hypothetical protein
MADSVSDKAFSAPAAYSAYSENDDFDCRKPLKIVLSDKKSCPAIVLSRK